MASSPNTSWQTEGGKVEAETDFTFLGFKITVDANCSHEIKRHLFPGRKAMTNINSVKKAKKSLCQQSPYSQSYGFSSSHVQMWELDHKEGWVLKNCCFWIVVLEKTLGSPLDKTVRRANQLILKKNQSWIFIGRTDAEGPILWAPDAKNLLIGKDCDAGKIWRQKEKGATEDVMVR